MSSTSAATQKWSNFGSSPSGPATSYRSVTASPSHFISISHNKLNSLSLDLLYPTPSVPAQPKDSSELLRRTLLISNAMMAAKKQVKIERHAAYDEARYNKRNTSSRGHLRGTARSGTSSIHALPSASKQLDTLAEVEASNGHVFAPSQANIIEAKEGEEWFEESWSETVHQGERDSAMFGASQSTSITVRSEYQEFSSTQSSEVVYHTKSDDVKHTEVQVLPVESDEESSSSNSSRSTSPVSSESEVDHVQRFEPELVAVLYTRPVVLPSQALGIASAVINDSDVPDMSLDDLPEYEHVFDASPSFARSEPSSSPLKPRLLPTIIRDKFYEPSRFETEVEEDPALVALSMLPAIPAFDSVASFEDVHVEDVYSSSPTESNMSFSDDDDELRTPDEIACDEFGYATGDNSFGASPTSFDEGIYFSSEYKTGSKEAMGNSDAEWEQMDRGVPFFP